MDLASDPLSWFARNSSHQDIVPMSCKGCPLVLPARSRSPLIIHLLKIPFQAVWAADWDAVLAQGLR